MDPSNKIVFDRYGSISKARKQFIEHLLPELIHEYGLKTALDAGCGVGFFSHCLEKQTIPPRSIPGLGPV